jgi:hypothetical protein
MSLRLFDDFIEIEPRFVLDRKRQCSSAVRSAQFGVLGDYVWISILLYTESRTGQGHAAH